MPSKRGRTRKTAGRARTDPAARERSLEALQQMRSEGLSLTRAARQSHTTPTTVRKYVGSAVRQTRSGRYVATPSDRLTRRVWFLTKGGKVEVAVRGSRPASRIARYMAAVDRYLRTGNTDTLAEFRGQSIRAGNRTYVFLTNTAALDRLAQVGEVSFERLYTRRA